MNSIGRNDFNSKFINFFLEHSRLVLLVLVAVFAGGLFSLFTLRREGFPEVTVKVIGVSTVFPGASSTEVETQISKVIEGAVKEADKVRDVSSVSVANFSSVTISLDQSANLDVAVQEIRSKVASIESDLPKDSQKPQVQTFSTGGSDFVLGLSDDSTLEQLRLAEKTVIDELSSVKGVKEVKSLFKQDEQIVVSYVPKVLLENNLNTNQIELAIKGTNLDLPLSSAEINDQLQSTVVSGAFKSIDELKETVIGVSKIGLPLKLKDVADVKVELEKIDKIQRIGYRENGKFQTKSAVLLTINISADADIINVKSDLDKKIKQIKSNDLVNENIKFEYLLDQSQDTKDQVSEIISGAIGDKGTFFLLGGVQLVLLAMLLFVNWRAALVSAAAIPISFLFTLIWLNLVGIQLNTIVLFSLILVLGLIVDPAIVVLESIQRYVDLGRTGIDAVAETGRRYGAGLFIAVATSIIVFIPFGVVSGIFGEIIQYIPATVIPALVASYFVPLAILPFIAARFLKPRKSADKRLKGEDENIWLAGIYMMKFNAWVLASNFRKVLVLIVIGSFIFFSLRLLISGSIPVVQFSSPEDNKAFRVSLIYEKGQTFSDRDKISEEIESIVSKESAIKSYYYFNQGKDQATIFVNLEEKRNKDNTSKKIIARINEILKEKNSVDASAAEVSVGPPESDYEIQAQLYVNNLTTLEKAAKEVGVYLGSLSKVEKVDDGFTGKGDPEIKILFDKVKLSTFGLSVFEASGQLKSILDQKQISKLVNSESDQSLEIFLQPEQNSLPITTIDLEKLNLVGRTGQVIQLAQVAKVFQTESLDQIQRFDGARFVNVRAKLKDKADLISVQSDLDKYLNQEKLKSLGIDSTGNKGEFDDIAKSFRELGIALVIAIFLTYIALVLQFNSFSQPTIMLFTIPLSFIGVFPALKLVNGQLGFLEILGITILVGIVENVGIFLIDYANQLREERNLTLKEAIILSSGVRFRPIILTKLVAIGGLLPLAVVSPFWRGLSSVIIGGILVSGFLSLTVVPIFYTWFGAVRNKIHRWN